MARGPAELRPVGGGPAIASAILAGFLGGAMSALGTSSQARKNAKKAAKAARDKEKDGQASTFAKENQSYNGDELEKWAKAARDKEKDGPESTIAKKRAQLQSSLANIEIMVYNLTQKQIEQNEREHRYGRLREEAAKDLQVHTITAPADATSA